MPPENSLLFYAACRRAGVEAELHIYRSGPHGFGLATHEEPLPQRAASPEDFVDEALGEHPMSIAARAVLGPRGELDAVRDHVVRILAAANEDPDAFCVTSRYVVAEARRTA